MPHTARVHTGFDLEWLKKAGLPKVNNKRHKLSPAPQGGAAFEQLRNTIDKLEQGQQAHDAAGGAATAVTAAVTPKRRGRPPKNATTHSERSTAMQTPLATPATPMPPNQAVANLPSWDSLVQIARDLGAQAGQGKDVQIKFALKVIEGAYLGALSIDPHKHGTDRRDGLVLAEEYVRAQNTAVIFDAKAPNQRKLVSNLDKCIKLGMSPKWGVGEPLQTVNELMTLRQNEKKAGKKVDDAFNSLMRFATAQLKRDTLLHGNDLKAFVYKRETDPRAAEDVLESVRKTLNALKSGKVSNCPDIDTSNEVQEAIRLMTKRLTAIAKAKGGNAQPATAGAAAPKAA